MTIFELAITIAINILSSVLWETGKEAVSFTCNRDRSAGSTTRPTNQGNNGSPQRHRCRSK